jgi:acyl dehydratase
MGRWRGIIASGLHTFAIAMRLICEGPLKHSESIGSPGFDYVKWPAPVRPGDQLRLEVELTGTRTSTSGHTRILSWRWKMLNQDDDTGTRSWGGQSFRGPDAKAGRLTKVPVVPDIFS